MNARIVDALNAILARKLTCVMQFMVMHYELTDEGHGRLSSEFKLLADRSLGHVEALRTRIANLGGLPAIEPDYPPRRNNGLGRKLALAEWLSTGILSLLERAAHVAEDLEDVSTRKLVQELVDDEHEHLEILAVMRCEAGAMVESIGLLAKATV